MLSCLCNQRDCLASDLSFTQALTMMKQNNENLKASRMEEDRLRHERDAARGLFFPKVTMGGRYTKMDGPLTINLDGIRQAMGSVENALHPGTGAAVVSRVPPFQLNVQDEAFYRANLSAQWPIFTGGRILAANRAADASLRAAQEKVRDKDGTLTSSLSRYYFGLRLTRSVEKVYGEALAGLEKHLYEAKKLEENGMIARSEVLHAEVRRAEAERQYKKATHDVEMLQTALNNILASDNRINPTSPLFMAWKLEPLVYFKDASVSSNPILRQLKAQKEMAHQSIRKEMGTFSPEIYLFGMRELYKADLTVLDPLWAVGIGANFTLFEGLSNYNRVLAAKSQERQLSSLEKGAQKDIDTLVENRYQGLMKAKEQYEEIMTALKSTEEYLRVRTRAFEEGLATSLDVVDAQLALSRVKIERLQAAYEFDVSLAELLEASGISERFDDYRREGATEVES